jgi:phenylpropionate dioxygenase-like ring-hydroxylating dioxygenase large terminal subunit
MFSNDYLKNDWHVVASSQDLQPEKILKVRLLGQDVVLWRSGDKAVAWEDRCPHRGASLALGWMDGDTLVCPYHGFAFDKSGNCVHIPSHPDTTPSASAQSKACVKTFHVQERYGLIWVCLGTPEQDIVSFPEWNDPNCHKYFYGPSLYKCSAFRALENFIDVNHFPFVHEGLGDPSYAKINDYKVEMKSDGIHISDVNSWENDPMIKGKMNFYKLGFHVLRPLTAILFREVAAEPLVIFYSITPVDNEECLVWRWTLLNIEIPQKDFNERVNLIMNQDRVMVESQTPKRLPLDLQAEFHLPSDRTNITYRKWLKRLNIAFGTI